MTTFTAKGSVHYDAEAIYSRNRMEMHQRLIRELVKAFLTQYDAEQVTGIALTVDEENQADKLTITRTLSYNAERQVQVEQWLDGNSQLNFSRKHLGDIDMISSHLPGMSKLKIKIESKLAKL